MEALYTAIADEKKKVADGFNLPNNFFDSENEFFKSTMIEIESPA